MSVVPSEDGDALTLQDAGRVFLTVDPIATVEDREAEHGGGGGSTDEDDDDEDVVAELREALVASQMVQEAKDAEISRLTEQLTAERTKYRNLWDINCAQLIEFDNAIADKDDEIRSLHHREPDTVAERREPCRYGY